MAYLCGLGFLTAWYLSLEKEWRSCKFSSNLLRDHVVSLCCNSLRPAWIQGQGNQTSPLDGGVTSPTAEEHAGWVLCLWQSLESITCSLLLS